MKILFFDDFKLGVLKGDTVVDVSHVVRSIPHMGPHDLINGLIERFADHRERRTAWATLASRARIARTWGDCFGYLLVATGRAEVMVDDKMNAWDSACLLPILEEAGGTLTDWRGRRTAFGGDTIATNAMLATSVRAILGAAGEP